MEKSIIHVYGGYPKKKGSIEEYYFALTQKLIECGWHSLFVFTDSPPEHLKATYRGIGAEILILPSTVKRIDFPVILSHARVFRGLRPTIVNVAFGRTGFNSLIAAHLAGIHNTVWTKHSFEESGPFYHSISRLKAAISIPFVQGCLARKIITISDGLKKELLLYGLPGKKIHRIYLGINLDRFNGASVSPPLLNELGIKSGDRVIACISQARLEKGLEFLIRAVPLVIPVFLTLRVLIVGGGPLTDSLKALSVDLNVQDHVKFCGIRDDVEKIIAASEMTVLPSLTEGLGLVVLESLAGGKPVIASNVGGIPEVVADGENGYLVPPRDEGAIADRIVRLLSNHDILNKMREACLSTARRFDVRQGAEKTATLYEQMAYEGS